MFQWEASPGPCLGPLDHAAVGSQRKKEAAHLSVVRGVKCIVLQGC